MPEQQNSVKITSRKFDGKIHRSWKACLISQKDSLLSFIGEFDDEIVHPQLGIIRSGTISYEFYWLDRWYNVFRFHEPEGDLKYFYCNINMPPTFKNNVLDYVDLDIDVLVDKDFRYTVLDQNEFEENSQIYKYPSEIIKRTEQSLEEILNLINRREFPFDIKSI